MKTNMMRASAQVMFVVDEINYFCASGATGGAVDLECVLASVRARGPRRLVNVHELGNVIEQRRLE